MKRLQKAVIATGMVLAAGLISYSYLSKLYQEYRQQKLQEHMSLCDVPIEVLLKQLYFKRPLVTALIHRDTQVDYAEIGGYLYCNKGMLVMQAVPSDYELKYQEAVTSPQKLEEHVIEYVAEEDSSACDYEYDEPVESLVNKQTPSGIEALLDQPLYQINNQKWKTALDEFKKISNMRYSPSKETDETRGRYIGDFHLHDNGTGPSDTDVCVVKEQGHPELVISHEGKGSVVTYYIIDASGQRVFSLPKPVFEK